MTFCDKLSIAYARIADLILPVCASYLIAFYLPLGWKGFGLAALFCGMIACHWPKERGL